VCVEKAREEGEGRRRGKKAREEGEGRRRGKRGKGEKRDMTYFKFTKNLIV